MTNQTLNVHETDNDLFNMITGNTYAHKDLIKKYGSGLWIPEFNGWLINVNKLDSLKNKLTLKESDKIYIDPKILNRLIECKECNYKIPLHTLDTHYMFCGTYTVIVYDCKNGKILTEDTFKYRDIIKKFNGHFKRINGNNFWYLSNHDYSIFKDSVKDIDIIENEDPIYSDLVVDVFNISEYLFD